MVKQILFLCNHNAGRSQIAQALFNHLNMNPGYKAISAGTDIETQVNPTCIKAMEEIGIDMSNRNVYYPKKLTPKMLENCHKAYTMGCNVKIDIRIKIDKDLDLEDPAGKSIEEVRLIRDSLKHKVMGIINELH